MSIQFLVLLLALVVEHQDFRGAALFHHLPGNKGFTGLAQFAFRAADSQHFVELHVFAAGLRQLLDLDYVSGCDAILLSPGADHRVHGNASQDCVRHDYVRTALNSLCACTYPSRKQPHGAEWPGFSLRTPHLARRRDSGGVSLTEPSSTG